MILEKKLKAQPGIAKRQYQELDKAFIFNKDNINVSESLIQKEAVAKTIANKRKSIISQI